MDSINNETISCFFANSTVFLTGGTGFVGRATLEKLLRGCPNIDKIYVLVRGKKGKSGEQRIMEILETTLFQRVRESDPELLKKIIPVEGDVTVDAELGISPEVASTLREEVSVVIHSAANTNFGAGLENLLKSNVGGLKNMIGWAKKIKNLKVFVHVSTAFSNTHVHPMKIEEKVYTSKINPHVALKLYSELPADFVESIIPNLLGQHASIYTFTKYLSETLIQEAQQDLPVCIVRPSIIGPALAEPFPGWIDNVTGFFQGCLLGTRGLVRVFCTNKNSSIDVVPIDFVVNLTLAAAMCRGLGTMDTEDVLVFNCSSSNLPCVDWLGTLMKALYMFPPNKMFWYPSVTFVNSELSFRILDYLLHYIPAMLLDGGLTLIGRKPKVSLVQTYHRTKKLMEHTLKVTRLEFKLSEDNSEALFSRLTLKDQKEFNFSKDGLNPEEYVMKAAYGFKRYVLREKDEDIPKALENVQRLYKLYMASWAFLALLIAQLLWLLL